MNRRSGMAGILAVMIAAVPVAGQTPGSTRLLSAEEQRLWGAVGQISYGGPKGAAICTGTLVAPDLVLTAGHCVAKDGIAMTADTIQFAAAWRTGESLAVRHGREVIVSAPSAGQPRSLSQDVALLVLDAPIGAEMAHPLPLSRQDLFSETYSLIGYQRAAPDIIGRTDDCALLAAPPGLLSLGCRAVSGNSGAPILMQRDGIWQVAAVMVAKANGSSNIGSYAAIPGDDIRARIATP